MSSDEYKRSEDIGSVGKKDAGGQRPKGESRFKVVKKSKNAVPPAPSEEGEKRTGGTSESIYATPSTLGSDHSAELAGTLNAALSSRNALELDQNGRFGGSSYSGSASKTRAPRDTIKSPSDTLGGGDGPVGQLRKSRSGLSLFERLGMDDLKEASVDSQQEVVSNAAPKTGGVKSRPPNLQWAKPPPTPSIDSPSSPNAQTPLSANHPLPETPLKHIGRKPSRRTDLANTPETEQSIYDARGSNRVGGLLLEAGGDSPVFPKELQTPKKDAFAQNPVASPARNTNGSQSQIDAMLAKLKLARTEVGTQQSRWAVKEPEASDGVRDGVTVQVTPSRESEAVEKQSEVPIAPRALRKTSPVRESISPAGKSLLERMSTSASEEAAPPAKGKKEKKRGGKRATLNRENSSHASEEIAQINVSGRTDHLESSVLPPANTDEHVLQPQSQIGEEEFPSALAPSTSAASFATDVTTEGSNVGNDTWGSINWADDDDDLPDLPEEWMRAANKATQDAANEVIASSDPGLTTVLASNSYSNANGNAQRGSRRGGGRGRGAKRDRQYTSTASSSRGIKIAGSANQASNESKQAPKELFPMHMHDNAPRLNNVAPPPPREQRLNGRPKLASSNKDTFSRLTKGALGPAPAAGSAQAPARKQ